MVAVANWQRGGTELENSSSLDEVIARAGLDYYVEPTVLETADDARLPVDRVANVRVHPNGDREVIGVVGPTYRVIHNVEALAPFDYLVRQAGARYTKAGTVDSGRLAYAFAELPEAIEIVQGDAVKGTLLWVNSFDGSHPVSMMLAPTRLVCTNQIVMAKRHGLGFTARHGAGVSKRTKDAARLLGQIWDGCNQVKDQMRAMAKIPMDSTRLEHYFGTVSPLPKDEVQRMCVLVQHQRWIERFEYGIGNTGPGSRTLYHALNAVTEDVDHRDLDRRVKNPAWYAILGTGGRLKQRAWAAAIDMVERSN